MRLYRGYRLGLAALGGVAIAGCNLALGLGGLDFTQGAGGSGGNSSSSSSSGSVGSSSTSSGMSSSTSTSSGGGTGGMGGHGGDGGMGGGPGTPVWAFAIGTSDGDDTVNAMAVGGPDNHIYLTGRGVGMLADFNCPALMVDAGVQSTTGGYLVELDTTGACVKGLFFGAGAEGTGLAVDAMGNVYLSGNFTGSVIWSAVMPTKSNGFLVALGSDFSKTWFHLLAPSSPNEVFTTSLAANADKVYVTGYMSGQVVVDGSDSPSSTGGMDGFVVRCPTNGGICSDTVVTFKGGKDQKPYGIALRDGDGEVAVIGSSDGNTGFNANPVQAPHDDENVMLGGMDSANSFNLTSMYGDMGTQIGRRVAFSRNGMLDAGVSDARLYFAGTYTPSITLGNDTFLSETGSTDVFIARLAIADCGSSTSCVPLNTSHFGSPGNETLTGLAVDSMDNVVVVGALRGPVNFGGTTANYTSDDDIYVAKMSSTLAPVWIKSFGSSDDQAADAVAIDTNGGIIVAGHYRGNLAFDAKIALPNAGSRDIFVVKLNP